jgi:hypothetical protein
MLQGMAAFSSRRYLDGSVKPPVRAGLAGFNSVYVFPHLAA